MLTVADWRAQYFSAADLADPAKEATVWGHFADLDADGFSNALEYALGGSPTNSASHPDIVTSLFASAPDAHFLRETYRLREGTTGLEISPQLSSDLAAWGTGTTLIGGPVSQGDGTALVTVQDNISVETAPAGRRFLRLLISF